MKTTGVIAQIFFFVLLLVEAGCEPPQVGPGRIEPPPIADNDCNEVSTYARYAPVKIDIVPLTEFTRVSNASEESKIKVYVSLLDPFGSEIKSPGIFRFELYARVPRSAEPKGRRITIWPDIDLTDVVENNRYWQDFLRAYEFSLPFELETNQSRILQVTCLCPNGKRLSAEFVLTHTK